MNWVAAIGYNATRRPVCKETTPQQHIYFCSLQIMRRRRCVDMLSRAMIAATGPRRSSVAAGRSTQIHRHLRVCFSSRRRRRRATPRDERRATSDERRANQTRRDGETRGPLHISFHRPCLWRLVSDSSTQRDRKAPGAVGVRRERGRYEEQREDISSVPPGGRQAHTHGDSASGCLSADATRSSLLYQFVLYSSHCSCRALRSVPFKPLCCCRCGCVPLP